MAVTYNNAYSDGTNLTTYSFAGVTLGVGYSVITIHGRQSSNRSISSVTIDGVTATEHVQLTSGNCVGIFGAQCASASGTVSITFSAGMDLCAIGSYLLDGVGSTVLADTGSASSTNTLNDTVTVVSGGAVIAIAAAGSTPGLTGWTNLTQNYNTLVTSFRSTGASADVVSSGSLSVTCTLTAGGTQTMVVASFNPPDGQPTRKRHGGVPFMGGGPGKIGGGSVWMPETRLMLPGRDFKRAA